MAYIGGGYGSARIRDDVYASRREHGILYSPAYPAKSRFRKIGVGEIEAAIEAAGISDHRIISDDSGFWIIIRKDDDGQKDPHGPVLGTKIVPENPLHFHDGFFFTE
jgi:hypothetical protein